MLSPEELVSVTALAGRLTDPLPVEVACVVPRRGDAWGAPVIVGVGNLEKVSARPSDVLRAVLTSGGDAFVLLHTHRTLHPPGDDDAAVTRRLVAAGAVVGLPLLAHVVSGPQQSWHSATDGTWQAIPPLDN